MGQAIQAVVAVAKTVAITVGQFAAQHPLVWAGIKTAVSLGLSYGASALADRPEVTPTLTPFKQATPWRQRVHGTRRISGPYGAWEASDKWIYQLVLLNDGRSEELTTFYFHDDALTVIDGAVQEGTDHRYQNAAWIDFRLGEPDQTAYDMLTGPVTFTGTDDDYGSPGLASLGIDSNFRHRGITTMCLAGRYARAEKFGVLWPNRDPQESVLGKWSLIWDPRDVTQTQGDPDQTNWTASDNSALQILDLLLDPECFGLDYDRHIEPEIEHWKQQADFCDEAISLDAGGTEPRYASSGIFYRSEEPKDVLRRYLEASDAMVFQDSRGRRKLWVGRYVEPVVWLEEKDIVDFSMELERDPDQAVNAVDFTYLSPDHKWTEVDGDPWTDEADIARQGRKAVSLKQTNVSSHTQARRIAKARFKRLNALERGTLRVRLTPGKAALGYRWIGVRGCEFTGGEDQVYEVGEGTEVSFGEWLISFPVTLFDTTAYDWTTAEEGTPPPVEGEVTPQPIGPGEASDLDTDVLGGTVTISWRNPAGGTLDTVEVRRGASSTYGSATIIAGPDPAVPLEPLESEDTPGSGTWYYWVVTRNDDDEASIAGPVTATVP